MTTDNPSNPTTKVVVPLDPTDEMLWAGYQADMGTQNTFEEFIVLCPGWRDDQRIVWRAMLEAANGKR